MPRFGRWIPVAALLVCLTSCSRDEQFPDQPILLICPWSAGGGTDRVSRQIAAQLESELGVPVNVINATGGGGVTGHTRGALARPDGYTLTMITVELSMLHWRGLTNVTGRDFAPLSLLNRDNAAIFVRQDSEFETLDELRDHVRDAETKLKASGTAYGGIWHIATAGWLNSQGLPPDAVNWVSINGAGPSIQELLAGGVDFLCISLPEAESVLDAGRLRCLGVMAPRRHSGFEDVPTFPELGHDWTIAGWRGLAAPRETPPERLAVLEDAVRRVTESETFLAFMQNSGFDVSLEGPEQFAQTLEEQDELFGEILTDPAFTQIAGDHFGPMLFPAIIGGLLLFTLGLLVLERRRESDRTDRTGDQHEQEPAEGMQAGRSLTRPLAVAAAVIIYLLTSETIGFLISAAVAMTLMSLAFRVRPMAIAALVLIVVPLTYQLFAVMLRVPLPRFFLEW